jgi:uroporphyrinogen-III decarboxylase
MDIIKLLERGWEMNCTERLYTAISGGVPDRVPVVPKIWVDSAANLTGTPLYEVIADPFLALNVIFKAGLELELDAVRQFHFPERKIEIADDKVYEIGKDGSKIGLIDMNGGLSTHLFDDKFYNLEDPYIIANYQFWTTDKPVINDMNDIKKIAVPDKSFYKEIGWEANQKKIIDEADGRIALIGDCSSATLAFYVCLRGLSNALFDLLDEPEMVHAAMEKGAEMAIEKGKFNIDLGLKVLRLNDSVANMSVISPGHWREFIKPHIKTVCDELHRYDKDVRIYCHICGNILPVTDDLIEAGIDCIGPLDPLGGFSCEQVRKVVKDRVSLMGGVNTLSFMNSTEEEIFNEAKQCILETGSKGAFILGSGCVVPRDAKRENILALVRTSGECGVYKDGKLVYCDEV